MKICLSNENENITVLFAVGENTKDSKTLEFKENNCSEALSITHNGCAMRSAFVGVKSSDNSENNFSIYLKIGIDSITHTIYNWLVR